jgi:hypothetical protein
MDSGQRPEEDNDHRIVRSKSPPFDPRGRMAGFHVFRGEKSLRFEKLKVRRPAEIIAIDLRG